jgi:hypothetical protein
MFIPEQNITSLICSGSHPGKYLHLIRVHRMERGEELLAVVKGRPVITVETKQMATLDNTV